MDEWCVFCGADSPGGIVCTNCREKLDDLPADKRQLIAEIEANEKARETLRAAMANLMAPLGDLLESIASLLRQFGRRS